MMGKARFSLQRILGQEERDIQEKAKKRSLWSSLGMGAGGALAFSLFGPAALPVMAASYLGGKAADYAAKEGWFNTKKAKIKGEGSFFQGQRKDIVQNIDESISSGSLKSGLYAGMSGSPNNLLGNMGKSLVDPSVPETVGTPELKGNGYGTGRFDPWTGELIGDKTSSQFIELERLLNDLRKGS